MAVVAICDANILIDFSYQNTYFKFEVPNMDNFCKKYYENAHAGKMSLSYVEHKSCFHQIVSSYNEDEIRSSFQKFIEMRKENKEASE